MRRIVCFLLGHCAYLDGLWRDGLGVARCRCIRCGKELSAQCGLDLPIKWLGIRKP